MGLTQLKGQQDWQQKKKLKPNEIQFPISKCVGKEKSTCHQSELGM